MKTERNTLLIAGLAAAVLAAVNASYAGETALESLKDSVPPPVSGRMVLPDVPATCPAESQAASISAAYSGRHLSQYQYMRLDVHRSQQVIRRYLTENLGCTDVKLCMTEFTKTKPGFFGSKPGTFTLKLTAACSTQFSDFRFAMSPAADWEEYTDVLIGYTRDSKWVESDIVARVTGEDFRMASSIQYIDDCDSSPVDPALPYLIIDPKHASSFIR